MNKFYIGLHQITDAKHFSRACLSIRRLQGRKKPIGCEDVLVDSAAFTELNLYGEYRRSTADYAAELHRLYTGNVVNISAAVAQDYMCEPFMLRKTGLTVAQHQQRTIRRYDRLLLRLNELFDYRIPFHVMPVLQGYTVHEYLTHVRMYGDRLKPEMWVGVGSVCKRNASPKSVAFVLAGIKKTRPDLQLHGFGIKETALKDHTVRSLLHTSDSLAWSWAARWEGRDQNDWHEAKRYADKMEQIMKIPGYRKIWV